MASAVPEVISLDEIMTQARRLQDTATQASSIILGSVGGMESATKGMTEAERQEAEAKNDALRAGADIEARKKAIGHRLAADFGTDPTASSAFLAEYAKSVVS